MSEADDRAMTAPTPEQMRALADRAVQTDDGFDYLVPARDLIEYNAALRAAADQLEAVAEWRESGQCGGRSYAALGCILDGVSDD